MIRLNPPVIVNAADYEIHFDRAVWRQAAAIVYGRRHLAYASSRCPQQGENIIVYHQFVIKIFAPFRQSYLREKAALEFANCKLGKATHVATLARSLLRRAGCRSRNMRHSRLGTRLRANPTSICPMWWGC